MPTAKESAIEAISSLPDDCSLDDIQYHLFLRRSIQRGIEDIDAGRFVSVEEMERAAGTPGRDLMKFMGRISEEDARLMQITWRPK